jgi:hypothetical protein
MGNRAACLSCFKIGDEESAPANNAIAIDKMSEIKYLEDIDVISHFDLQQIQFKNREEEHKQRRSFYVAHKDNTQLMRSNSMCILKGPDEPRPVRYSYNPKNNTSDSKVQAIQTANTTDNKASKEPGEGSPHDHAASEDSYSLVEHNKVLDSPKQAIKELAKPGNELNPSSVTEGLGNILDSPRASHQSKVTPRKMQRLRSLDKSTPEAELQAELRDTVQPIVVSNKALTKKGNTHGDSKSISNLSIEHSHYSFKSCNEFDNLTFASLVSSKSNSKRSKASAPQKGKLSKRDVFEELMFEIEHFSRYFDFGNPYPFEEVLQDWRAKEGGQRMLLAFCPQVQEFASNNSLFSPKRRITIVRGMCLLKKTLKNWQNTLNRKVETQICSRIVQKRLQAYGDFDNELDSMLKYVLKAGESQETIKTIRIGTSKKYAGGKQTIYMYERSADLHDFYAGLKGKASPNLVSADSTTYLLKSVQRVELLSPEYIKVEYYAEFYFPDRIKISHTRQAVREYFGLLN